MSDAELYRGREQSLVKHLILRRYLQRFTYIIGSRWGSITYVDCFSGPWNSRSDRFADTSFGIALSELRKARETLRVRQGKDLQLRCYFLEKTRSAYEELQEFVQDFKDVEIRTRNAPLEESIDDIIAFAAPSNMETFPFIFIDPTGWTGFALDVIEPLLNLNPGEVLINFVTEHIRRFIDSPHTETQQTFARLFGSIDFRESLNELEKLDRDDAAVFRYMDNIKKAGGFSLGSAAVVLHPEINRSHFHLIYLTRDAKGIEVFKDAERRSMKDMEAARAKAQQTRRQKKRGGQRELFAAPEMHDSGHVEQLRERYLKDAKSRVVSTLRNTRRISYDEMWAIALSVPLVWDADIKAWIDEWKSAEVLTIEGMRDRQRVPRRNEGNTLVWHE